MNQADEEKIKEYIKLALGTVDATKDTIVQQLQKDFPDMDTKVFQRIKGVANNSVGVALSYDKDKPLGENVAFISGSLVQDIIVKGVVTGGIVLSTGAVAAPALLGFVVATAVNEGLKKAGIDLGEEAQEIYSKYLTSKVELEVANNKFQEVYPSLVDTDGKRLSLNEQRCLSQITPEQNQGLSQALKDLDLNSTLVSYLQNIKSLEERVAKCEVELEKLDVNETTQPYTLNYTKEKELESITLHEDNVDLTQIKEVIKNSSLIYALEYNEVTLEEASSLPKDTTLNFPKDVLELDNPNGNTTLYTSYDDELKVVVSNEDGTTTAYDIEKEDIKIVDTDNYELHLEDRILTLSNGNFVDTNSNPDTKFIINEVQESQRSKELETNMEPYEYKTQTIDYNLENIHER